jgi:cold shock protein
MGFRDQIAGQQSWAPHVRFGSKADIRISRRNDAHELLGLIKRERRPIVTNTFVNLRFPLRAGLLSFWCNMEAIVAKGTVKWFNATKGYGFIQPTGGGRDVFVHISAVERAGLSTLNEGQSVEYEEVANKGKTSAENLKVAGR